ncbi:hypothetical protein LTR84_005748 [Exophiala bonariae]|uniref:Cupin type-2 domain-containing protein n=1 Tax=Exophiala bonariae TaxID=1690606 RepID=A0AAV9N6Q3_9EURO|nr:hypothetical protein LTR84_005748 [Exophiala bonariae]
MANYDTIPDMGSGLVSTITGLPPVQRHIVGHDTHGRSVYLDSPAIKYYPVPNAGGTARSYAIASVPAVLHEDADLKAYLSADGPTSYTMKNIVPTTPGANLLVVDLIPGAKSQHHQTVSIDFSICVSGEIVHELDSGEEVRLFPGDHIIQRGTMHRWKNGSDTKPARFIAVTLPCETFNIGGNQLQEKHLK